MAFRSILRMPGILKFLESSILQMLSFLLSSKKLFERKLCNVSSLWIKWWFFNNLNFLLKKDAKNVQQMSPPWPCLHKQFMLQPYIAVVKACIHT
jgi:hypothetical protein